MAVSTVLHNLEVPWGLAFYPDGRFIVTERPGRFHVYTPAEQPTVTSHFIDSKYVHQGNEGGLLGVALHPTLKWVYFYYTHQAPAELDPTHEQGPSWKGSVGSTTFWNRVIRTNTTFTESAIILDHIPAGQRHNGGRMKFGPDSYLYIGVGDTSDSKLAQDPTSLAGKILRVTDEGKPVPGNPYGNEIYASGIRNCQGLTWSTKTGHMFVTSHGDIARDNVFMVSGPGANFGWPTYQGDTLGVSGVTSALLNSGPNETWAPSGLAYHNGSLYFGGLRGSTLYQIVLDSSETKAVSFNRLLANTFGRLRDVVSFGGHLYITTSNRDDRGTVREGDDKVIRTTP